MLFKERLNNNYDFLRLFAALCIIYTHSYGLVSKYKEEPLVRLTNNRLDFAFLGLSIFFSISGYLITKSALNSPSFKNYIWKRFLRIQPMLILVCFLSVFLLGPIFSTLPFKEYFSNIGTYTYFRNIMPLFGIQFTLPQVFTNNIAENGVNGSLWTLIIEERLYLLIGILFLFKNYSKHFMLGLILTLNILYFLHFIVFDGSLIKYLNGGNVFYALIFLNSSAYYLLKTPFLKLSISYLFYTFLISVLIVSFYVIPEKPIQVLLIPLLVLAFAHLKGITNNTGQYGDFTYGIYAFSFPIQQMLISYSLDNNIPGRIFFLTLIITFPIAILTWHLIEKRMVEYKELLQ